MILEGTLGLDFINDHMIELANYLNTFVSDNMKTFLGIANALGAIFALIVAGIQAYKIMSQQEGRFDILAIGRPILFALILANWSGVVTIVTTPGNGLEGYFRGKYESEKLKVAEARELRKQAADSLYNMIQTKQAATDQAKMAAGKSGMFDKLFDALDSALETVKGWVVVAQHYVLSLVEKVVQWLGELYWQVSVYYIFLLKAIYMAAAVLFGPIYMVCSILPAWRDSWQQWVGRVVSISFYGAMAYLVMIFSMQLMKYGIEADTKAMTAVMNGTDGVGTYIKSGFGTIILTTLTMFCGAQAMSSVPEIASWVIPSQAIHAAGGFMGGTTGVSHRMMNKGGMMGLSKGASKIKSKFTSK